MARRLKAAKKTDVGKQREQNEDACFERVIADNAVTGGIFIIADGMGGYHAGEVASKIAIETVSSELETLFAPASSQPTMRLKGKRGKMRLGRQQADAEDDLNKTRPLAVKRQTAGEETPAAQREPALTQELAESVVLDHYAERLRLAVEQGSEAIVEYGRKHSEARGLGSTLTAALIIGDQAFIANVGDSRTYLLRDGRLERITQDHSLVERLVQAGQIEP